MRPILIHPGLHKTGTSWLQAVPFSDIDIFNNVMSHEEVDAYLVRPHEWQWDPQIARDRIAIALQKNERASVNVLSSEILTGNPFFGSREAPLLARRLREVLPHAKILLTVREQGQWLRSLYQQYVKRGGRLALPDFLSGSSEPQYKTFDFISLEFDRFVEEFSSAFGRENVLVLPQELLRTDMRVFFEHLSSFLGVEQIVPKDEWRRAVGASPPEGSDWLLRLANSFRDKPLSRTSNTRFDWFGKQLERAAYRLPTRGTRYQVELPEELLKRSNIRLQDYCPTPLSTFGYLL